MYTQDCPEKNYSYTCRWFLNGSIIHIRISLAVQNLPVWWMATQLITDQHKPVRSRALVCYMSINISIQTFESREDRLGSISGYSGNLKDLCEKVGCGNLANRERCFSQTSTCNAACAFSLLSFILDAAIIQHSPSGCAVTAMQVSNAKDQLAAKIGRIHTHSCYVCTDLNETDTIYGATDRLKSVVLETYNRYKPNAIFIGASCVSGVIGEDLEAIQAETNSILPIPVSIVYCEGFKTRIWASGFDAAFHAILYSIA